MAKLARIYTNKWVVGAMLLLPIPICIIIGIYCNFSLSDFFAMGQLVVFLYATAIAAYTISSSRKTAKESATLNVILGAYSDGELITASKRIFDAIKTGDTSEFDVSNSHLLLVLNRYEFYASAINQGILDEALYKRLQCSNFIKLWVTVRPFVYELRKAEKKDTLFADLEILVDRWEKKRLTLDDLN